MRSPLPVMSSILPCPGGGEGAGDISSTLPYTALPHGASPQRDFAQQGAEATPRMRVFEFSDSCETQVNLGVCALR